MAKAWCHGFEGDNLSFILNYLSNILLIYLFDYNYLITILECDFSMKEAWCNGFEWVNLSFNLPP